MLDDIDSTQYVVAIRYTMLTSDTVCYCWKRVEILLLLVSSPASHCLLVAAINNAAAQDLSLLMNKKPTGASGLRHNYMYAIQGGLIARINILMDI